MNKPFDITKLGIAAALLDKGKTARQFSVAQGVYEGAFANPDLGRQTAKLAADIFEAADMGDDLCCSIYHEMAKSASWHPMFENYLEPFIESVKKAADEDLQAEREEGMTKLAEVGFAESILNILRAGKTVSKETLTGLAGLGLLGGAATGAASWALEKDIDPVATNEPSLAASNEALRRRRNLYRAMATETKARLSRDGSLKVSPGAEVEAASKYV